VTGVKFLHTSDWHLGRSFGPVSLLDDQRRVVQWMVELAVAESVDLVVVAGDVYDRAVPPVEAIELFGEALATLQGAGIAVVVIAGNHDSAERVAVYDGLVAPSGIHICGGYRTIGQVITLHLDDGPLDVVPLPFLDPALAPLGWTSSGADTSSAATTTATTAADEAPGRVRRPSHEQVLAESVRRTASLLTAPRSLAVAHAFVVSGGLAPETSDSERSLSLGGSAAVQAAVFDPFSYTALGHLHAPQVVGGHPRVRYSGTPLAYSFGETGAKTVVLGEMSPDGSVDLDLVPVPVGRRVITLTGTLDELVAAPRPDAVDRFVRVRLTDPGPVLDARQLLQAVYPHVIEVELRPSIRGTGTGDLTDSDPRRSLDPLEVAVGYWSDLYGVTPTDAEAALIATTVQEAMVR
jgi:exonuclease SbcD